MEKETISCLNCGKSFTGSFCSHCGQSAKVARFTLANIFTSDFLQKIIYLHKGFFYSVKELFTRPGHSVREYMAGKRVSLMNYLALLVIVIILFSLVEEITPFHFADLSDDGKEMAGSLEELVKKHPKIVYVGIIPYYALFSFLFFRKARQNYAEHFVLNTFKGSALLLLTTLFIAGELGKRQSSNPIRNTTPYCNHSLPLLTGTLPNPAELVRWIFFSNRNCSPYLDLAFF